MTLQCPLPCRRESCYVQTLDVSSQLVKINAAVHIQYGMEQHPRLHRRKRIKVFKLRQGYRQTVQLLLGDARQGEIRWGDIVDAAGAMGNQRFKLGAVDVNKRFDSALVVAPLAIAYREP